MHLTWKDGVATILVAAVVVPFVGILALVSANFFDLATRQSLLIGFMAVVVLLWTIALLRHGGEKLIGTASRSGAIPA